MREWQSQSHVRWYCRYHIVFVPKCRRRSIYGSLRRNIGGVTRELCRQHHVELVEGHAMADHIHLCVSIPPKYSVAKSGGETPRGPGAVGSLGPIMKQQAPSGGLHQTARFPGGT